MTLFTIGHSNHPIERFIALLQKHQVDILVDVRSIPASRWNPQFDRHRLERALREVGIVYRFMGNTLGGRPDIDQLYDQRGYAIYDAFVQTSLFQEGVTQLLQLLRQDQSVALMCAEEDPNHCHRRLLIASYLYERYGIDAVHIRKEGSTQTESQIRRTITGSLFEDDPEWTLPSLSSRPIPRRGKKDEPKKNK